MVDQAVIDEEWTSTTRLNYQEILMRGLESIRVARAMMNQSGFSSVMLYRDTMLALEQSVTNIIDREYLAMLEPIKKIHRPTRAEVKLKLGKDGVYDYEVDSALKNEIRSYWEKVGAIRQFALMNLLQRKNKLEEKDRAPKKSLVKTPIREVDNE